MIQAASARAGGHQPRQPPPGSGPRRGWRWPARSGEGDRRPMPITRLWRFPPPVRARSTAAPESAPPYTKPCPYNIPTTRHASRRCRCDSSMPLRNEPAEAARSRCRDGSAPWLPPGALRRCAGQATIDCSVGVDFVFDTAVCRRRLPRPLRPAADERVPRPAEPCFHEDDVKRGGRSLASCFAPPARRERRPLDSGSDPPSRAYCARCVPPAAGTSSTEALCSLHSHDAPVLREGPVCCPGSTQRRRGRGAVPWEAVIVERWIDDGGLKMNENDSDVTESARRWIGRPTRDSQDQMRCFVNYLLSSSPLRQSQSFNVRPQQGVEYCQ